ncbi:MAG TPA: hypothetical protein VK474_11640 [Chthoniobacterales bacterium]|nr:hypothetical protein [Chthoniobacterales bacterium]
MTKINGIETPEVDTIGARTRNARGAESSRTLLAALNAWFTRNNLPTCEYSPYGRNPRAQAHRRNVRRIRRAALSRALLLCLLALATRATAQTVEINPTPAPLPPIAHDHAAVVSLSDPMVWIPALVFCFLFLALHLWARRRRERLWARRCSGIAGGTIAAGAVVYLDPTTQRYLIATSDRPYRPLHITR